MLYQTAFQPMEAPLMMLTGMVMAAAALLFHMLRHVICAGKLLSLISDIFLGTVWSAIFLTGLTIANRGSLRLYHILSAAAGAMLFHAAIGVPLRRITGRICRGAGCFAKKLCQNRVVQALIR